MSLVTYNNVCLPYPYHTNFQQQSLYVDNTDWYCTKFDLSLTCLIFSGYVAATDPTIAAGTSVADIISIIRPKLLTPRKTLSVKLNGSELIPARATGSPADVDAQNGPQPQSLTLSAITDTSILCTYRIVAHYWEKHNNNDAPPVNAEGSPILSNRWEENVEIDAHNYTTRRRTGTCILRSDNAHARVVDQMRTSMAVVGVPPGFLRQGANYTVSRDGLRLSYSVTDKEVYQKPPSPAFSADGTYEESVSKFNTLRYGVCNVTLRGSKTTSQTDLINTAIDVAFLKINARRAQLAAQFGGASSLVDQASVRQDLYKNEVSCNVRARLFPKVQDARFVVNAFVGMTSVVPLSVPQYTPAYLDYGTAGLVLHAAAYYDPSVQGNALIQPGGRQMNNGREPGTGA